VSAADFDAWLAEHPTDVVAGAFVDRLAQQTGEVVIGESDDGPTVVAIPDDPS
jgi:hypothetical protein